MDKRPGIQPVGVGETRRRLFANIILKFAGLEATMACKDYHMGAGIKAVIYSAINGVQALWDDNSTTENWGFLLVDAKNVFNKII